MGLVLLVLDNAEDVVNGEEAEELSTLVAKVCQWGRGRGVCSLIARVGCCARELPPLISVETATPLFHVA
jgi:hypothetical protein